MALLRSRFILVTFALAVVASSLAIVALRTLPASSHGNYPVVGCNIVGTGADLANLKGIRFTAYPAQSQTFVSIEVHMDGSVAGAYAMTAELRRSDGFTGPFESAVRSGANLPGTLGNWPYQAVHFDFPVTTVLTPTTFTLRFVDIVGPPASNLYLEVTSLPHPSCPNVQETNENDVAAPTEATDPAGFLVMGLRAVQWGDVDCSDGPPTAVDALKVLRKVAGLTYTQTQPCPALGDLVRP